MPTIICKGCGISFHQFPVRLKVAGSGLFCSRACKVEFVKDENAQPLTAERVREVLDYDSITGIFRWKKLPEFMSWRLSVGDVAGTKKEKYIEIMIAGQPYAAHRLAWFYVYGEWPVGILDHHDRHQFNNAIDNLRPATNGQNRANSKPNKNTSTGLKGVTRRKDRFIAQITVGKRSRHLGMFATAEEAHDVYVEAAKAAFGEFARP